MGMEPKTMANVIWLILLVIIVVIIPIIGAYFSTDSVDASGVDQSGSVLWPMIQIALNIQSFEWINLLVAIVAGIFAFVFTIRHAGGEYFIWGHIFIFMTIWLAWSAFSFGLWKLMSDDLGGLGVDWLISSASSRYQIDGVDVLELQDSPGSLTAEVQVYFGFVVFFTVLLVAAAINIRARYPLQGTPPPQQANTSNSTSSTGQAGGRRRRR